MKTRQIVQLILAIALVAAALRLGLIYLERHEANAPKPGQQTALDPDYYVTPRKLYAYDLKSARAALVGHPAWVREGYKFTYYPYEGHRVDFAHAAGLLTPLERLDIRDIVQTPPPGRGDLPQIAAVFEAAGREYAVPVGARKDGDYTLYPDDMFFYDDPHELYRHWKPEIWQAVDSHQVKPGMNELQVSFALGMGVPQPQGDSGKTVVFPNGGHETIVTFRAGRAAEIRAGSTPQSR